MKLDVKILVYLRCNTKSSYQMVRPEQLFKKNNYNQKTQIIIVIYCNFYLLDTSSKYLSQFLNPRTARKIFIFNYK